jgi:diguanylate cyclase
MHYKETREQSAEILRMALTFMARQEAAFHPPSYSLWYEHAAGINPELTQVLEARLTAGIALTDTEVRRLYAQHVLTRDMSAFERIEERLKLILEEVSRAANNAGSDASRFGDTLVEHSARLESEAIGPDLLRAVVADLLADTRHLCMVTRELSSQLDKSVREIGLLTERLEQAQTEALLDPLTRLCNRRGLERSIEELGEESRGLTGAALLIVDLDHFKTINDTHGHLLGDKVLRAVAQILRANIKGRDVAARIGGEEFAVFLPDTTLPGAAAVAQQIREAVAKVRLRRTDRNEYIGSITASIGVAHARSGDTLDNLIERADEALYCAKRAGRNRVSAAGPRP